MRRTLITGVTGFLGRNLLWRRLQSASGKDRVLCLIRAESDGQADERLQKVLSDPSAQLTDEMKSRAIAVCGDISKPRLGMSETGHARTAKGLTDIVHCAASVSFSLPLEQARNINVEGTRRMLDLARRARSLKRFDYVGTAYVAGGRKGVVKEDELDLDQEFHNTYEHTKAESEKLVRDAAAELPVTIFRPSIVVGNSKTGITQSFNVMYWPLKVFARQLVLCIPADPQGVVDIVPIDYVIDVIEHVAATQKPDGSAYHIASGPDKIVRVDGLAKKAAKKFGVWMPPYVSPQAFYKVLKPIFSVVLWGRYRRVINVGQVYIPYLSYRAVFDTANTEKALAGTSIRARSVNRYFDLLMQYCIESDWGKKPLSPERLAAMLHEDVAEVANL